MFKLFFLLISISFGSYAQNWEYLGGAQGKLTKDIIFTKTSKLICSINQISPNWGSNNFTGVQK